MICRLISFCSYFQGGYSISFWLQLSEIKALSERSATLLMKKSHNIHNNMKKKMKACPSVRGTPTRPQQIGQVSKHPKTIKYKATLLKACPSIRGIPTR